MQGQIKNQIHQSQQRKGWFRSPYLPTLHEMSLKSVAESGRMNMAALEKRNVWRGKDWCALFPALTSTVVLIPPDSAARAVCLLPFSKQLCFPSVLIKTNPEITSLPAPPSLPQPP